MPAVAFEILARTVIGRAEVCRGDGKLGCACHRLCQRVSGAVQAAGALFAKGPEEGYAPVFSLHAGGYDVHL